MDMADARRHCETMDRITALVGTLPRYSEGCPDADVLFSVAGSLLRIVVAASRYDVYDLLAGGRPTQLEGLSEAIARWVEAQKVRSGPAAGLTFGEAANRDRN